MEKVLAKGLEALLALALLVGAGYLLYPHTTALFASCDTPRTYAIASIDSRFGIGEEAFRLALLDAEAVWEAAAGKELFMATSDGEIQVSLVYGDEQRTNELGNVIDGEQEAFEEKKRALDELKDRYTSAKEAYERAVRAFDARSGKYHADVEKWNSQGGAPPSEYARLERERNALQEAQHALTELADTVNTQASTLNGAVEELNALAKVLNAKVARYNEHAGDAFDQGDYQEDASGKRITVYEFTDGTDLRRVLVHELGHALGIGHVEDPDSVMYAFNAGDDLILSEEDIAALKEVCGLE